jgi:predicted amidohydrolase YtcJ
MTINHALYLAVLAGMTSPAAAAAPDAIYRHGKVVTMDGSHVAEAFAVRGDRFVAVGTDAEVTRLAGKATHVVDLDGATVIPGLTDAHDHLWNSAKFEFRGVDMIGVKSLAEMQARLRAAVAKAEPGQIMFTTMGWAIRPAPTRADLDAVSTTTPIMVLASRHATGMVNSAALAKLSISKANPMFQGAKVPVDKDGEPTGAPPDYPGSLAMADALLPALTPQVEETIVQKAMAERNALGITSTRELALWPQGVAALTRLRAAGKPTVRMALGLEFPDQAGTAQTLKSLPKPNRKDSWLFVDSIGEEPWTPRRHGARALHRSPARRRAAGLAAGPACQRRSRPRHLFRPGLRTDIGRL